MAREMDRNFDTVSLESSGKVEELQGESVLGELESSKKIGKCSGKPQEVVAEGLRRRQALFTADYSRLILLMTIHISH